MTMGVRTGVYETLDGWTDAGGAAGGVRAGEHADGGTYGGTYGCAGDRDAGRLD
jgi:hypothetical protein